MAWYVKNVERSQKWGSVGNLWNAKSCFANARVKREFIKKNTSNSNSSQILKRIY